MWALIDSISRVWRGVPRLPLRFCGFGLVWLWGCNLVVWLQKAVERGMYADGFLTAQLAQDAFVVAQILAFASGALLVRARPTYLAKGPLVVVPHVLACGAIAVIVLSLGTLDVSAGIFVAAAAVAGFAYAWVFLLWAELLGVLPTNYVAIGYIMAIATYFVTSVFSHHIDVGFYRGIVVGLPLGTLALLLLAYAWAGRDRMPQQGVAATSFPWQMLPFIVLFATVFDLSGGFVPYNTVDVSVRMGRLVPVLVLLGFLLFQRARFDFSKFYGFVVALMAIGVFTAFFAHGEAFVPTVLTQAGAESYSLLLFVVMGSYAFRLRASAAWFYGVVAAFNLFVCFAVDKLRVFVPSLFTSPLVLGVLYCVALVVLAVLFNRSSVIYAIQPQPADQRASRISEAVKNVGRDAKLSAQESAVLRYALEGASTAHIAEELFIAPGTVRVHMSNIYRKVGVHTREELLERCLADGEGTGQDNR